MQLYQTKIVYINVGQCRYFGMQNNVDFNKIEALRGRRAMRMPIQEIKAPVSKPVKQCPEKIWSSLTALSNMNRPFLGAYTVKMSNCDGLVGDFKQGTTGDCWLLSGLKSLAVTPIGADIIRNYQKRRRNRCR